MRSGLVSKLWLVASTAESIRREDGKNYEQILLIQYFCSALSSSLGGMKNKVIFYELAWPGKNAS